MIARRCAARPAARLVEQRQLSERAMETGPARRAAPHHGTMLQRRPGSARRVLHLTQLFDENELLLLVKRRGRRHALEERRRLVMK